MKNKEIVPYDIRKEGCKTEKSVTYNVWHVNQDQKHWGIDYTNTGKQNTIVWF